MSRILRFTLVALACLASSAIAGSGNGGSVTVTFADPDRYTDAGVTQRERERHLALIERFLIDHVAACLKPDDRVAIRVLDVRLAGRYEWWRSPEGVRIMDALDWPRLKLEYRWQDPDGNMLAEKREWISDTNYLRRAGVRRGGPLAYEQRMIRDWARADFCDSDD